MVKKLPLHKFKPGVKYRHPDIEGTYTYIGPSYHKNSGHVFESIQGTSFRSAERIDLWREYIAPVTHTKYVHWYRCENGQIYTNTTRDVKSIKSFSGTYLKTDTVTFVES